MDCGLNFDLSVCLKASHQRPLCAKGAPAKRVGDCRSSLFYNPSASHPFGTSPYTGEALQRAVEQIKHPDKHQFIKPITFIIALKEADDGF